MTLTKALIAIILVTLIPGCATLISGQKTEVNIVSTPSEAKCNYNGQTTITPGRLLIDKQKDTVLISCNKPGYIARTGLVYSKFNPITLLNILTGPLMIVGFPLDFYNGSSWEQTNYLDITLRQ
jgi:hypothetical protein